ncbi:hypothetical protein C4J81_09565 [Deltaproteobacteria bacterium Smac51]|nr:hypothetical protein C4J81_09565 [Deltaproteobacteria bacterium Smac51]
MSFGSVSNDYNQNIWGAAAYTNQQAATIGRQDSTSDFKSALEDLEEEDGSTSFGFGSTNSEGGLTSSISAMLGSSNDMLSQLQFTLLKNNSAANGNSLNSRLSESLL